MSLKRSVFPGRCAAAIIVGAAFFATAAAVASAQAFQFVSGSNTCREAGRGGVFQLAGAGGYVVVGETSFAATGCTTTDIYVTRVNANGTVNWTAVYNIGGNDSATCAVQSTVNNDLYICGVTQNVGGCTATRDGFILRVNVNTGATVALNTYGSSQDEILSDIVQARTGDGVTTNNGDMIVVGSTRLASGTGRDALILRVNAALGLIWGRQYGGPGSADDYFYGVDEASSGVPAGSTGDIIAVGGTNTFGVGLGDILVARVNGANGLDGATPQNIATYGGARLDEARSVRQLKVGALAGQFIITGNTNSRPAPSTNTEGFIIRAQPNPCLTQFCDAYFGDDGGGFDNGRCIREIPAGAPAGMTPGNWVMTGTTVRGNATVTGNNAYFQEITTGCAFITGAMAYGGNGFDEGWSVNVATNNAAPQTPGYVIAGYTQSSTLIGATDPQQLYLIKTRVTRVSGCNETTITFSTEAANFTRSCPVMVTTGFAGTCGRNTTPQPVTWGTLLCFAAMAKDGNGDGTNDGVSAVGAPETIGMSDDAAAFYPNPVESGMPLNVRFNVPKASEVAVTVVDLLGRTVYSARAEYAEGVGLHTLPTAGWTSGTYVVSVSGPAIRTTSRSVSVVRR